MMTIGSDRSPACPSFILIGAPSTAHYIEVTRSDTASAPGDELTLVCAASNHAGKHGGGSESELGLVVFDICLFK